jgi:hypothetical protein
MLAGRPAEIHAERDRKLEEARYQRRLRRQQAGMDISCIPAKRREMIDSGLIHALRHQMVAYKKALAIASGLLAGGFLYQRFGLDNSVDFSGWQGAALLGGIGLAGIFPRRG